MQNSTNITKYKRLAPVYDLFFGGVLKKARAKAIGSLTFNEGCRILIMGVGTGEDFRYIPDHCNCVGIDISEPMLEKAREKAEHRSIELIKMNAENVTLPDGYFDIVILNLILSVAENPNLVVSEAIRVLKDDGRILVFDKFVKSNHKISFPRKVINNLTVFFGTDINRCFEKIIAGIPLTVIKDTNSFFRGAYRIILLRKVQHL
jgi:ubiquinone/menaquinone biosynthesis C-methylase UbiE